MKFCDEKEAVALIVNERLRFSIESDEIPLLSLPYCVSYRFNFSACTLCGQHDVFYFF